MSSSKLELTDPSITIATELIMLLISITGLFLNGIAVYITRYRLKSKNAAQWLMLTICIVDILVAIVILVADVFKYATSWNILNNNDFCQFTGCLIMLLTMTTIDGVGLLSLLRALSIVKDIEIRSIYWYTAMGSMILYNTVINIIGVHYNIMRVMPAKVYCHSAFNVSYYSRIFSYLLLTKFVLMMAILMICYICITIKYYKFISPLNSNNSSNECFLGDKNSKSFQRSIIYKLIILLFMYMICFFPTLLTFAHNVTTRTHRVPIEDAICGTTMNLTVLVNAAFVLLYQHEAREVLISMLPNWIYIFKTNQNCRGIENFDI